MRENGYYWIRRDGPWEIAQWEDRLFFVINDWGGLPEDSDDIVEIGPIVTPPI